MKMVGDVMKMGAADTLPLAPGKPLQLKPGGYHFMLMDLQGALKAGSRMQMTLRFRDAQGRGASCRSRCRWPPRPPNTEARAPRSPSLG